MPVAADQDFGAVDQHASARVSPSRPSSPIPTTLSQLRHFILPGKRVNRSRRHGAASTPAEQGDVRNVVAALIQSILGFPRANEAHGET